MIDQSTLDHLRGIVAARKRIAGSHTVSPLSNAEVLLLIDQAGRAVELEAAAKELWNVAEPEHTLRCAVQEFGNDCICGAYQRFEAAMRVLCPQEYAVPADRPGEKGEGL